MSPDEWYLPEDDDGQQQQEPDDYRAARIAAHEPDEDQMKASDMLESKYLKQSDVDEDGTVVTIQTLKKVNVARDDEEPDYRWTVTFSEFAKPMVLNATNIKRVATALGDDTEDWLGKQVKVYCDPNIEFGGKVVGGLRIKGLTRTGTSARQATPDDVNRKLRAAQGDDEIPF